MTVTKSLSITFHVFILYLNSMTLNFTFEFIYFFLTSALSSVDISLLKSWFQCKI